VSVLKYCEGCGRGMLIEAPLSAKLAEKYCNPCKPSMEREYRPLGDYSTLRDTNANITATSEVNREWGTDLNRRQIRQLAWVTGMKELAK
jgi:hypothetical protein